MKRLTDIIYSPKAPQIQSALWLKKVGPFTCIPYINEHSRWVPLNITIEESHYDPSLKYPVFYLNSLEDVNTITSFMELYPYESYEIATNNISTDLPYIYVAVCKDYTFEVVNAEFPSDILTSDFVLVDSGSIKVKNKNIEYNLYKYVLIDGQGNPMPLESPINITITNVQSN